MGIENLFLGFQIAITPFNIFVALVGILLGTIIGVLPGLGGANGVAILLPVTFSMPPTSGIILLTSIHWGALFGGAITSIPFNITGQLRLTFGFTGLMKGFDFIVAVIGLFGIGEILLSVEEGLTFKCTPAAM